MSSHLDRLVSRVPALAGSLPEISATYAILREVVQRGGRIFLAGNGGSAADADHWSGELLKGFARPRPVASDPRLAALPAIAARLQGAVAAIPLGSFPAFTSAFGNDADASLSYAQLLYALGRPGDVFVGLSTSGNAANICAAAQVARALQLHIVGLTGRTGGRLAPLCEQCICVPADETYLIQEMHLPIYHCLSLMLEDEFFG
jgi:D-sedoheptulose 7-phosphate isomerase